MCGKNSNSPANVDLFFVDLYQGKLSSIPISFTFINQMYLLLSCFRLKRQRGGGWHVIKYFYIRGGHLWTTVQLNHHYHHPQESSPLQQPLLDSSKKSAVMLMNLRAFFYRMTHGKQGDIMLQQFGLHVTLVSCGWTDVTAFTLLNFYDVL